MQPGRRVADQEADEAGCAPDRTGSGLGESAPLRKDTARTNCRGPGCDRLGGRHPGTVGGDGRADHRQDPPFLLQFLVMPGRLSGGDKPASG